MVATRVIGCGYNYPSIRLVIHRGSFRSFAALHQEFGRLARDGRLGINRVISSTKSRGEAPHLDSSFAEPNVWITDTENCRRHNGATTVCDNGAAWFPPHNPATTVCGNRERCRNNPPRRCRWSGLGKTSTRNVEGYLPKIYNLYHYRQWMLHHKVGT